ncbi:branched-chain amino acid ABC transporter permease [Paraburkholderia sp. GAS334]|uniref:branched-chain amino acid ABC transporter permease n=1 Tax=Paraburkholderia sp. GAS334 TaxID=3035131 RepID=UPI003D1B76FD
MNISLPVLAGQLLMGIVNGSFYAVLSLGLAVIFGLLGVVNFAHGAFFMLGAVVTYIGMSCFSLGYWAMLVVAPLTVGILATVVERFLLRRIYKLDHMYGMLLTLGLAMVVEAGFQSVYGSSGLPYDTPAPLDGAANLGFMILPVYRAWVVVIALSACAATWFLIERTRLGAYLRAGTENSRLVEAFGVNVPRMITFTYAFGAALAAFAGVLAAPVMQVSPLMGQNYIVVVFAIVVIGGMGSITGAVISGLALGLAEAVAKVVYPESSATIVFAIMIAVLLICPAGLFGKQS